MSKDSIAGIFPKKYIQKLHYGLQYIRENPVEYEKQCCTK